MEWTFETGSRKGDMALLKFHLPISACAAIGQQRRSNVDEGGRISVLFDYCSPPCRFLIQQTIKTCSSWFDHFGRGRPVPIWKYGNLMTLGICCLNPPPTGKDWKPTSPGKKQRDPLLPLTTTRSRSHTSRNLTAFGYRWVQYPFTSRLRMW